MGGVLLRVSASRTLTQMDWTTADAAVLFLLLPSA